MKSHAESDGLPDSGSMCGASGCILAVDDTPSQDIDAPNRRRAQSAGAMFCRPGYSENALPATEYGIPLKADSEELYVDVVALEVTLKAVDVSGSCVPSLDESTYAGSGAATPSHASAGAFDHDVDAATFEAGSYTTVFLSGLSESGTQMALLQLLDKLGFAGKFDLVAVPFDLETLAPQGKAWINAVSAADAVHILDALRACLMLRARDAEVPAIEWSEAQGYAALVEKFRNSRMMHKSFPEEMQPQFVAAGHYITFPKPTGRLGLPKPKRFPAATIRE